MGIFDKPSNPMEAMQRQMQMQQLGNVGLALMQAGQPVPMGQTRMGMFANAMQQNQPNMANQMQMYKLQQEMAEKQKQQQYGQSLAGMFGGMPGQARTPQGGTTSGAFAPTIPHAFGQTAQAPQQGMFGQSSMFSNPYGAMAQQAFKAGDIDTGIKFMEMAQKGREPAKTRERKVGDKYVFEEFNPRTGQWTQISEAGRYKPTTNVTTNVYNSPEAKLLQDIAEAEAAGDTEKAADLRRSYEKKATPSGESIRIGEMTQTGQEAMGTIIQQIMPGGNVDMNAVASMSLALPWTEGRTLDSQMLEAVGLMLRMETGAAQTEDEVANVAKRYRPSMFDSPETVKDKLTRLKERFDKAGAISGRKVPAGDDLRKKYGLE